MSNIEFTNEGKWQTNCRKCGAIYLVNFDYLSDLCPKCLKEINDKN